MTREGKAVIASAVAGLFVGLTICVLFGVLDVQCSGTGRPNWNAQTQTCE